MPSPLNALVSQVLNNVRTGLHGKADVSISSEQIITELLQTRADLVKKGQVNGRTIFDTALTQELPLVEVLTVNPLADWRTGLLDERLANLNLGIDKTVQRVLLPGLLSKANGTSIVDYLGPLDESRPLKVLYGSQARTAKYDPMTGRWPHIVLQEEGGTLSENCPPWLFLLARVALFDPRQSSTYGKLFDPDKTPGPWPDFMEGEMVTTLTNKYVSQYGRYLKTPDTGPDSPL